MTRFAEDLLARVEEAGLNASAAPQQRLIDGWLVRFSPGKAKRARCANAVAAGRQPLDEKLRRCADLFRAAGLPLVVRITPFSQPAGLDRELDARGWHRFGDTRVMLLGDLRAFAAPPADASMQQLPVEPFARSVGMLRGSTLAQRQAHAQRLADSPVPFHGWGLGREEDGHLVACGQIAIEDGVAGLYDLVTAERERRRGFGRRVAVQLLAQAVRHGATVAYLQVDADNEPARALYRSLGFADGYAYHYRSPDAAAT